MEIKNETFDMRLKNMAQDIIDNMKQARVGRTIAKYTNIQDCNYKKYPVKLAWKIASDLHRPEGSIKVLFGNNVYDNLLPDSRLTCMVRDSIPAIFNLFKSKKPPQFEYVLAIVELEDKSGYKVVLLEKNPKAEKDLGFNFIREMLRKCFPSSKR